MTVLKGKKILLGVSGSIAAYKAAFLTRLLKKAEAEVKVVMTASASDFISPLTLSTLSKNPVLSSFTTGNEGEWNNHVELGLWADLMLVAPASAHTLSKFANGVCNDLLTAVYLSARCPVWVAPAMDLDMYTHPSTTENMKRLTSYGNRVIDAGEGELASGLHGQGRMAEPEEIIQKLETFFGGSSRELKGKKVLITAGPTYEAIDPVRFIGNHSTGKMGYAIAKEMLKQGAEVTLVSGPSAQEPPAGVKLLKVTSATEMYDVCRQQFPAADIAVFSAAVSDFRPDTVMDSKIKKEEGVEALTVRLVKNPDIASEMGRQKKDGQFTVGFALETDNERNNALRKLENKNLDLIVLNSLNDEGAGFGHDTNKITILSGNGSNLQFDLKSKEEVARDIVLAIISNVNA